MRRNHFHAYTLLSLVGMVLFCIACDKSTSKTVAYDVTDATIKSFRFIGQDSFPGLAKAKFIVEDRIDTGIIRMEDNDSIMFGTRIDSVRPYMTYGGVPAAVIFYTGDTSFVLTGYDTLNFTIEPMYFRVFAADRKHEKWYRFTPRVHQSDPDLYTWNMLCNQLAPSIAAEQQAFLYNDTFLFYRNNGSETKLYISTDGITWSEESVTGIPADCHPRRIVLDSASNNFCYADPTGLYTSADGKIFAIAGSNKLQDEYEYVTLLLSFDDHLWSLVREKNSQQQYIAYSTVGQDSTYVWDAVDQQFPVSGFATTSYIGSSGLNYGMVAGGYSNNGTILNTIWSIESTSNGYRLTNVARASNTAFANAAVIYYGKKWIRFGGIDKEGKLANAAYFSEDEGYTWQIANSKWNMLPTALVLRHRMSVIQHKNDLYIIGGHTSTACHSDVYKGRLNSIDW